MASGCLLASVNRELYQIYLELVCNRIDKYGPLQKISCDNARAMMFAIADVIAPRPFHDLKDAEQLDPAGERLLNTVLVTAALCPFQIDEEQLRTVWQRAASRPLGRVIRCTSPHPAVDRQATYSPLRLSLPEADGFA